MSPSLRMVFVAELDLGPFAFHVEESLTAEDGPRT